jgi:tetratricopeptide (TPR) repeat protein
MPALGIALFTSGFLGLVNSVPKLGDMPTTVDLVWVACEVLLFLAGALLIGGSIAQARYAGICRVALVVFSVIVFACTGYGLIPRTYFYGHGTGILVAQFSGPEETYGLADHIIKTLQDTATRFSDIEVHESDITITQAMGDATARQLGRRSNAKVVIWGSYHPNPFDGDVHFDVLPDEAPDSDQSFANGERNLDSFTIHARLASQANLVALLVAGISAQLNSDHAAALQRFLAAESYAKKSAKADHAAVYFYEGRAYQDLTRYNQAADAYRRCIGADKYVKPCYISLGDLFQTRRAASFALEVDNDALALWPRDPNFLNNRGNAEESLGDTFAALSDYNAAIAIDPSFWLALSDRGNIEMALGDCHGAKNDYIAALNFAPSNSGVLSNMARYLLQQRQYLPALWLENRAVMAMPTGGGELKDRAIIELALNMHSDARADLVGAKSNYDRQQDIFHSTEVALMLKELDASSNQQTASDSPTSDTPSCN